MPRRRILKVVAAAAASWEGTWRSLMAMPLLVVIAASLVAAAHAFHADLVLRAYHAGEFRHWWSGFAGLFGLAAVTTVVMAALAVAIIRHEVLNERPTRENFPGPTGRILRVIGILLPIALIYLAPSFLAAYRLGIAPGDAALLLSLDLPVLAFSAAASVVLMIAAMPLVVAIAVESPAASLSNAIADSAAGAGRTLMLWLLVSLPIWGVEFALSRLLFRFPDVVPAAISTGILNGVALTLWTCVMSVAAEEIYRCYGQRLSGRADDAPGQSAKSL